MKKKKILIVAGSVYALCERLNSLVNHFKYKFDKIDIVVDNHHIKAHHSQFLKKYKHGKVFKLDTFSNNISDNKIYIKPFQQLKKILKKNNINSYSEIIMANQLSFLNQYIILKLNKKIPVSFISLINIHPEIIEKYIFNKNSFDFLNRVKNIFIKLIVFEKLLPINLNITKKIYYYDDFEKKFYLKFFDKKKYIKIIKNNSCNCNKVKKKNNLLLVMDITKNIFKRTRYINTLSLILKKLNSELKINKIYVRKHPRDYSDTDKILSKNLKNIKFIKLKNHEYFVKNFYCKFKYLLTSASSILNFAKHQCNKIKIYTSEDLTKITVKVGLIYSGINKKSKKERIFLI